MWHFKQKSPSNGICTTVYSLLHSSPPFPLLLERVSLYTQTTDFRGQIKPFPPLTSIHPSLHQCSLVSWSAVKQDLIGKELLINNTWPVRAPPHHHFLCHPHLTSNSHLLYFFSPLSSSSSWFFPLPKSSSFFSLPTPPVPFQLSSKPPAGLVMFAASLVSAQPGHSVKVCTWKSQEIDFLVVEQYNVCCWLLVKSNKPLYNQHLTYITN